MLTACAIKETCSFHFIYRAGIWKPRTRPDSFQGAGDEGLQWLSEVKARYGLPVATEVATAEHVYAALDAGIDYLWAGARTSANPIAVESIAQAIMAYPAHQSKLKAVFIKNPVNEDAALWLGNIERLEKTGISVIAVHRGCGHKPCWRMAHAVRQKRPDIAMLLDPSHMSGDAKKVAALTAKTAELGLDGAMIEVHYNPAQALSDQAQQIKPEELQHLLLPNRPNHPDVELHWLRAEIDELDGALWETIAARMDVSRRIGEWKKTHGVAPLQPERYRQIVESLDRTSDRLGLSKDFVEQVWELIHKESLREQIEITH